VRCALEIQATHVQTEPGGPSERKLLRESGGHLGDVNTGTGDVLRRRSKHRFQNPSPQTRRNLHNSAGPLYVRNTKKFPPRYRLEQDQLKMCEMRSAILPHPNYDPVRPSEQGENSVNRRRHLHFFSWFCPSVSCGILRGSVPVIKTC